MIYLDSAATSFYKPTEVKKAALRGLCMGNPGRGGHKAAMAAAEEIYAVRVRAAEHFGSGLPEGVCFFGNATTAFNAVIKGLLKQGGRVLISDMEHNAVLRPALGAEKEGAVVDFFRGYGTKREILESFAEKLKPKPRLIVFLHRSNICPQTLPVRELCALAADKGILTLIDCAQSAGHLPISLCDLRADGLVIPSHKGLMGIMGAGMLICSKRMKEALENVGTVMEGGSGVRSFERGMPELLPERLEWGTPPLPAILSIGAGISYIERHGYEELSARTAALSRRAGEGIGNIAGLRLRGMKKLPGEGGPLLFVSEKRDQAQLCRALFDAGVCLREGFHCAPLAHKSIGTEKTGGVRVSFSPFNKPAEIERFLKLLDRCARDGAL